MNQEKLEKIRRRCRPQPLEGDSLKNFFRETDKSRDVRQNTRQRLWNTLNEGDDVRLLFCGHMGCGKSTELNKFLSEHQDDFFPVKFSVHKEMSPVNIRAEDLLLVMAGRAITAARDAGLTVDEGLLRPIEDYFSTEELRRTSTFEAAVGAGAGVNTKAGVLGRLVGLFARVSAEVKFNSHGERTAITYLRRRPADLLAQVNMLFGAISRTLENRRLLVVVEDLDKLGIAQAQNLFVDNHQLLTGVICNVVYTIPIFLFYSPDASAFIPQFDGVVNQRMIQTMTPDNSVDGCQAVKDIVHARLDKDMVSEEALDLLVRNTAGVLRHVFEVLSNAANAVDASIPLSEEDIQYGLDQLAHSLQAQINLPLNPLKNGPQSRGELLERLSKYARMQDAGEKPPPEPDPTAQLLLKSCALVEYNGIGWFGVHPLVKKYLERLGYPPGTS